MVFSYSLLRGTGTKIFFGPVLHCSKLEAIDQNKIFGLVLHCSIIRGTKSNYKKKFLVQCSTVAELEVIV